MEKVRISEIIKIFLQHAKPYKWLLSFIVFGILVAETLAIIVPIFYKKFFDTLSTASGQGSEYVTILTGIIVTILILHSGSWLFHRIAIFIHNWLQPTIMANLERKGFDYLLGHSSSFFANNFTGSLVRKVRRLSRAFEEFSDNILWELFPLLVIITGSMIVISFRSTTIVLLTIAWLIVFIISNYIVARWKLKYDEQKAEKDSEVTGVLADALTNQINVKLFANQMYEKGLFKIITEQFRKLRTYSWNLSEVNDALQYGLMIIIEFGVMYLAIGLWNKGEFTVGDFALLQGYLVSLFIHVHGLGRVIRRMYEAFADAKEMVAILNTPHEIQDTKSAKDIIIGKGKIDFSSITFRYRRTRTVFNKFKLVIKPKEKVAFVGPSGSGKTTIVQLLLRMHDVQKGKILIDGQNISKVTQNSLRKNIALVPQDPILFHRTLIENIRYGRLDATDKEVKLAAKKAHCEEFISKLSDKYNTYVGERGIKLSGGERQRIAIARAILTDAPILVLDEATSSLDSESEEFIQEALVELMKNKTTIVIAHRLSTILKMDRIIVMKHGEVVDTGTHKQLSSKKGLYKKLWEIQSSGFTS
jgi:ATP-binding cassette, subfamily B, bacterial